MATIGPTEAKVTPIITGSWMPNQRVIPRDWMIVATPQQKRSAEIKKATSSGASFNALPTISGTATAPAYMTRTCCRPSVAIRKGGSISSTGSVVTVLRFAIVTLSLLGLLLFHKFAAYAGSRQILYAGKGAMKSYCPEKRG